MLEQVRVSKDKLDVKPVWSIAATPAEASSHFERSVSTFGGGAIVWLSRLAFVFERKFDTWRFVGKFTAHPRNRRGWCGNLQYRFSGVFETGSLPKRYRKAMPEGYGILPIGAVSIQSIPGVVSYDYKQFFTPKLVAKGIKFAAILDHLGYKPLFRGFNVSPMAPLDKEEYGDGFHAPDVSKWIADTGETNAAMIAHDGAIRLVVFDHLREVGHVDFSSLHSPDLIVKQTLVGVFSQGILRVFDSSNAKPLGTVRCLAAG
jgi:hypothetical protein